MPKDKSHKNLRHSKTYTLPVEVANALEVLHRAGRLELVLAEVIMRHEAAAVLGHLFRTEVAPVARCAAGLLRRSVRDYEHTIEHGAVDVHRVTACRQSTARTALQPV